MEQSPRSLSGQQAASCGEDHGQVGVGVATEIQLPSARNVTNAADDQMSNYISVKFFCLLLFSFRQQSITISIFVLGHFIQ